MRGDILKKKITFLPITKLLFHLCLYLALTVNLLNPCFSQQQRESAETITITTYYPAPYGVYRDLQTQRLAVGDTNRDGVFDSNDMPDNEGDLYVAGDMYTNLGRHKMEVQFMNLGEDEYAYCGEEASRVCRPTTRDTCNGDATRAYSCPPNENKTCYDVHLPHEYLFYKEVYIDKSRPRKKPVSRRVICQAIAAWKGIEEIEELEEE